MCETILSCNFPTLCSNLLPCSLEFSSARVVEVHLSNLLQMSISAHWLLHLPHWLHKLSMHPDKQSLRLPQQLRNFLKQSPTSSRAGLQKNARKTHANMMPKTVKVTIVRISVDKITRQAVVIYYTMTPGDLLKICLSHSEFTHISMEFDR